MIEQPALATVPVDAAQPTIIAPRTNGRRPLIEVPLPATDADNDTSSFADLCVQLERAERRIIVRGELDIATVPVLADAIAVLINHDPGNAIIDITRLSFIDAAGLGCLVGFANQLAACGAKASVVGASPRLRRVFDIVQLGGLLEAP